MRALTGVDTDRLPEEKARGITIDLGFAPLDLPGGMRLGVVDVPGHERLVRTMVAGASGIDLLLLVVAADEGVMPQTREHLAICELMGVTRGVVALSKIDTAGPELADLAAEDVRERLAGSVLADAPVVRVSSVTGEGLDALRRALETAAANCPARTPRRGPPRLAIDRAFAARGFGAVVTGTLVGGALCVGDAVEIQPDGRSARIRGLQCHGTGADRIEAGSRCAVNLQGIELRELSRGQVVTGPGALEPTRSLDVELAWLELAPALDAPASVELLTGTAERRARVAPIGAARLGPGTRGFARLHVDGPPLPVLPGDAFVLRGFARTAMGGTTLGGGHIVDVAPPQRRRHDPQLRRELEVLARGEPARSLAVRIGRGGLAGAPRERLRRESGLAPDELDAALESLRRSGEAQASDADTWLRSGALRELEQRLLRALDGWHDAEPLQPGMPRRALLGRLPENVPRDVGELALAGLAARDAVRLEADAVRRSDHRPALGPAQQALARRVCETARRAGLEPPGLREWAEQLGSAPGPLRELLAYLEREGLLVRAREDLWFDPDSVAALRERVAAHLREHGSLDTSTYKTLIGTSRRTAVPLMELFDEERLTLRRGDLRFLRKR